MMTMMTKSTGRLFTLVFFLLLTRMANAGEVMVAVAANFTAPMKEIADLFHKKTGHSANLAFGSSGQFTAQIQNGAPFEVFLSADQSKPEKLIADGLADGSSRFTYANGSLALWSAASGADVLQQLKSGQFNKLALASPKLAPYGEAAVQTLAAMGLTDSVSAKQVMGENIAQTWQFVSTGNAQLGFVALSQIMADGEITGGSAWIVPENLYQPIRQDAVLLKKGADNPAAQALLAYLKSDEVTAVITRYGYSR